MRDSKNFTAVCDNAEEPSDEQKSAARFTVCGNARDLEDATMLLHMLGLYPGQTSEGFVTPTIRKSFS